MIVSAASEAQTGAIAAELAPRLRAGDLVCLHGDLGAGKTTFVRALVAALGSDYPVSSPTFTLVHEYAGPLPVAHIDAYRLAGAAEFAASGLDEYLTTGDWLVLVEWPERVEDALPPRRWEIALTETGPESRTIRIEAPSC